MLNSAHRENTLGIGVTEEWKSRFLTGESGDEAEKS